jgi:hypothetical protein
MFHFKSSIFKFRNYTTYIYTFLGFDDSSKQTKLLNHYAKNVSIATGIHKKKKLSHTITLSTLSSMGQKLITIDTFLNNGFNA